MKYFIDNEDRKVRIAWVIPAIDDEYIICWDLDSNEYKLPKCVICDDGEPDCIEISMPIEFPNGFVPPETFNASRCYWCQFASVEENVDICGHKHYKKENCCPIRKYFDLK